MSRLTSNGLRSFQQAWNAQASQGLLEAAKHLNELGLQGIAAWIPNEAQNPQTQGAIETGWIKPAEKTPAEKTEAAHNAERVLMKHRVDQAEQRANRLADKCGDLTNELTNERARCRELERKIERLEMKAKR